MPNEGLQVPEQFRERVVLPETGPHPERSAEAVRRTNTTAVEELQAVLPSSAAAPARDDVDPLLYDIETVLSDGLQDTYMLLDEATRAEFKREGEVTASKIAVLIRQASVNVRKIGQLIVRWLKFLPGVSRLFVEQEAKIKTDRLLDMRRTRTQGEQQ